MRYLFLFLITSTAFASLPNWSPENGLGKVWLDQGKCLAQGLGQCFDVSKCPVDECSVQLVNEDDLTKPLYAPQSKVAACSGLKDCKAAIAPICDEQGVCTNYCDGDLVAFIAKDHKSVYCTKFLGYAKHDVKKLFR